MDVDKAKRMVPVLVPGARTSDVESLAKRINRYDFTGSESRYPSMDSSFDPRDVREGARLIDAGGFGLTAKEKSAFSAVKLLAELFPGDLSAYETANFRNAKRLDLTAKVPVSSLPVELQQVGERLAGGKSALTLEACVRGLEFLLPDEKEKADQILRRKFGFVSEPAPSPDGIVGWQVKLPSTKAPVIATSRVAKDVSVGIVEEPYVGWKEIETVQAIRIKSRPGDLLVTCIGVGNSEGPVFEPDQTFKFDKTGKIDLISRHLGLDHVRYAVVRPGTKAHPEPKVIARIHVFPPRHYIELPSGADTLTSQEVEAGVHERILGPASEMAQSILDRERTLAIWSSASERPDLSFRTGRLPENKNFIEVPLLGAGGISAFVEADSLPKTASELQATPLTYFLKRSRGGGHTEIAGPFFVE